VVVIAQFDDENGTIVNDDQVEERKRERKMEDNGIDSLGA
jgi:hypothetical protein